jgi:beta-glucosidase
MRKIKLPEHLLLGAATAATQIEGGDKNCNWYYWSLAGKIANGGSSITAADHWNRYIEDVELMDEMNLEVYRMGIEWSRIEPSKGVWSAEGISHYKDLFIKLKEKGIEPLLTLHHFSCPEWVQVEGAWTNSETIEYFIGFVEKVVTEFGEYVSEYVTINEPNVFVTDTYMDGKYPGGKHDDILSYFKASKNLIIAHLKSYKLIHEMRTKSGYKDTRVGFAHHLAYFEAEKNNWFNKFSRNLIDHSFHHMFTKGFVEGKLTFPLGFGYPEGKGLFCDFIGVNYYSRHIVKQSFNPAMLFGEVVADDSLIEEQLNDLGWEIYPDGLYKMIKPIYEEYELPIYITENGIPDEHDVKREKFIIDHLLQVKKLIDDGIGVERYYHWSLLDNLEWNDGYYPRFGLIEVNYDTYERKIRPSGHVYAKIIKNKEITIKET